MLMHNGPLLQALLKRDVVVAIGCYKVRTISAHPADDQQISCHGVFKDHLQL